MAQPQQSPVSQQQYLAQQAMLARHQATQAQQAQQAQQMQGQGGVQGAQPNYQQLQNAQAAQQQQQHQQQIANILVMQQQRQHQAQAGSQSSSNPNQTQGIAATPQQNLQAAMFAAQAQRQQASMAADSSPQTASRSSPNMNGAAKPANGAAQNGMRIESIMANLPNFISMMEKGQLTELQVQQLRNILGTPSAQAHLRANATVHQQQLAMQQAALATNNTSNVRPPANIPNGMTPQQAQAQLAQFQSSAAQVQAQAQAQQRQAQAQVQAQNQAGATASPRPPAQPMTGQQQSNALQHQKALQQITNLDPARRAEIFAKNPPLKNLWEKHIQATNPAAVQAHLNAMNLRRQQQMAAMVTQQGATGSVPSPQQNGMQLPNAAAGPSQLGGNDPNRVASPALPNLQIPAGRQRNVQQGQGQQLGLQQQQQQGQQQLGQQGGQQMQLPKQGQMAAPTPQQQQMMVRAAAVAQAQAQAAIAAAAAAANSGATANVATQASMAQARLQQMAQLQQQHQQGQLGTTPINIGQRINQLQQQSTSSRPTATNSPRNGAIPPPHGPHQGPMPPTGFAPVVPFFNNTYTPTDESDATLKEVLQTPAKWPNVRGPRPTLSLGLGAGPVIGTAPLQKMPADIMALDEMLSDVGGARGPDGELLDVQEQEIVGRGMPGGKKRKIIEVAQEVDKSFKMNPGVEDFCLEIADEFLEGLGDLSCKLAKRRGGDRLEVKDIQLHLERNLGVVVPGFASDAIRLDQVHISRKTNANSKHQQRLRAVTEARAVRVKELAAERVKPDHVAVPE